LSYSISFSSKFLGQYLNLGLTQPCYFTIHCLPYPQTLYISGYWQCHQSKFIPVLKLIKNHAIKSKRSDLGTRWKLVVRFTPPPLYPRGEPSLRGLQSRFGRYGEQKNIALLRIEPEAVNP
jgi:hypothetical protein